MLQSKSARSKMVSILLARVVIAVAICPLSINGDKSNGSPRLEVSAGESGKRNM